MKRLFLLTLALGCGSNDSSARPDASPPDASPHGDANVTSDASVDGGCNHGNDPEPTFTTVDASGALTVFKVGAFAFNLDLTSDGKTALIEDATTGNLYFYDTTSGVLTIRANVSGDPSEVMATSIAGNGARVGAMQGATDVNASVWDQCTSWTEIANPNTTGCGTSPPVFNGGVFALNGDGTVGVGNEYNGCTSEARVWTYANGAWTSSVLQNVGPANASNRASAISDDGKVIGGFTMRDTGVDRSPTVWKDGTATLLDPSGQVVGEVLGVSPDGTMATGIWNTVTSNNQPYNTGFYWTTQDGVKLVGTLPTASNTSNVWLVAIAADNRLVFGQAEDASGEHAIVWTKQSGMRKLDDIVAAQGIKLTTGLTTAMAASSDGTVVLGGTGTSS